MTTDARKFSNDVVWNVGSLAVSGACGIFLNYLIGIAYDEAALGVFNQVFAAYIFFSQIAVLGVHHSALQGIAATDKGSEKAAIATSALVLTLGLGLIATAAFVLSVPLVARLLSSADVGAGMYFAAPGLLFFAINKVTLACLNAVRRMRWYAVLQGMRFVLMLVGLLICLSLDVSRSSLPILLTGAEFVILVLSLWAMRDLLRVGPVAEFGRRCKAHFDFGARGFMSGVLGDLHSRVDVLMLGYFASDSVVGIYSYAAILAEGFFQLLVVLRVNYAPICVRLLAVKAHEELVETIRRARNLTYLGALPLAAIASVVYAYLLPLVIPSPTIEASAPYFAILMAGIALSAGYMPFFQLLLHARRPGWHTWLMLGTVTANVSANALLIPAYGAAGAAIGTSVAFVTSILLLLFMARQVLGLRI